jgi:23S rRNA (adenine2503-C2)-methyltransferase
VKKKFLASADMEALAGFVRDNSAPSYRAAQIAEWIYKKRILKPQLMKNIPLSMRNSLESSFICSSSDVLMNNASADGTLKLLIGLHDSETIEAVLIPSEHRMTFCLSTQVGCPVRCRFCASGNSGLTRNLDAGEIIEQFYHCHKENGGIPDNIVFMGIGEGLLNFNNLARALRILTDSDKTAMSPRRITVSTSGWTKGIIKLAELGKQFNLAVSLHAPDDKTRAAIIPDDFRCPVAEILKACDLYREKTGRMPTFEYTLLKGINDSPRAASELALIAREHRAKVNLIPCNETGSGFKRPSPEVISKFQKIISNAGVTVTRRVEKGGSSNAACGQLRNSGGNS